MTMNRHVASLAMLALTMVGVRASAQEILVGPSAKAKSLSGIVRQPDGTSLAGASIELFDCGNGVLQGVLDPHILDTTKSDAKGKFELKWPMIPRVCLQFQSPGMHKMQMEVLRAQDGGKLDVKLVPGN
jgi:hypothetical protein